MVTWNCSRFPTRNGHPRPPINFSSVKSCAAGILPSEITPLLAFLVRPLPVLRRGSRRQSAILSTGRRLGRHRLSESRHAVCVHDGGTHGRCCGGWEGDPGIARGTAGGIAARLRGGSASATVCEAHAGAFRRHDSTAQGTGDLQRCARPDSGTTHILPPDLGLDSRGEGEPWGPGELRQEGLREARSRHIPNPDAEEIVRLGLLAAAKRRSLAIEDERAEPLIRMTLFDLSPSDKPVDEVGLTYVANQVKASLNGHLNDTTEQFDLWITDPKSNLLRRIAKRQDCSLSREEVRAALLQLGWESLKITAHCIDAQMQAFRDALPNPLPPADRSLFDQIYVGQTCWGGFPLVLLHNRFSLLREAILELWQAPLEQSRTAVLHSMMYFYGSMLNSRRESDRHYKRAGKLIIGDGKLPFFEPIPEVKNRNEDDDSGNKAGSRDGAKLADPVSAGKYTEQEYFRDAAIHIANMRGLLPVPIPWHLQAELIERNGEQITIRVFSEQDHIDENFSTTAEEFRAEVEELL